MVHDTSESKVDTTVQSLLGRCCGYGKNTDILIYCDKFSAEKYKNWVESGFDINLLPDKSKNVSGKSSLSIKTIIDPIELDVSNNEFVVNIMGKRKSKKDKINILKSLNNDYINSIIKGEFEKDWNIGTILNVDVKKHNDSIESKESYTSYQKQYLDVLNNKIYMGDYKIKEESEEGKTIISGAYEIQEKKNY